MLSLRHLNHGVTLQSIPLARSCLILRYSFLLVADEFLSKRSVTVCGETNIELNCQMADSDPREGLGVNWFERLEYSRSLVRFNALSSLDFGCSVRSPWSLGDIDVHVIGSDLHPEWS